MFSSTFTLLGALVLGAASLTSAQSTPWGPNEPSNCDGSTYCSTTNKNYCTQAYNRFDNNTRYNEYTSYVNGSNFLGNGCTAIYRCDGDYGKGMTGAELKEAYVESWGSNGHDQADTCY
jgi:hypothetical protein